MGVNQDDFFEEVKANEAPKYETKGVSMPFPAEDYDKKGNLKKCRPRVLRKLLKYEWKYYFPLTIVVMALLLVSGLYFGLCIRSEALTEGDGAVELLLSLSSILIFLFACVGGVIFSQVFPVVRYNKNFFQNEGYLTLSVPASAEEHILAKRIAAVLCTLAVGAALILTLFIVFLLNNSVGDFSSEVDNWVGGYLEVEVTLFDKILFTAESILSGAAVILLMPTAYGAISCFLSKANGKKKTFIVLLLVFFGTSIVETLLSYFLVFWETVLPATTAGLHIYNWVNILLEVGLTVACTFYEIGYLKRKLDLK